MKKKITFFTNLSKSKGGAIIAALRIYKLLKKKYDIKLLSPKNKNISGKFKILLSKVIIRIFIGKTNFLNSLNIFSTETISNFDQNILHVHWIGNEALSLDQMINYTKPIIWTMHDMWPITSTEHFLNNPKSKKYDEKDCENNYLKKIIYRKKKNLFKKKNIHLVANSKWLANFAQKSELTKHLKINTIYNPIDTNIWKRKNNFYAKKKLHLPLDKKFILFGAHGGLNNPRKGGYLFLESTKILKQLDNNLEVIILGGNKNYVEFINGTKFHFRKLEHNQTRQRLYHSASLLTVSASKAESLPQFLVETILCGNPVVAFNVGGNSEIVTHKNNGYLVKTYDANDFKKGIIYCIKNIEKNNLVKANKKIRYMFNEKNILKKYINIINKIN